MRPSQRKVDEIRTVQIRPGFSPSGASILFQMGNTIVQCAATVEERVPPFVAEGEGWMTAEYAMLPAATHSRGRRERTKLNKRGVEIQRLIGRSLRAAVNLDKLGPRTVTLDCDVLSADGGTRCASISGAYIALVLLLRQLEEKGELKVSEVMRDEVAAVSVGLYEGTAILDLEYIEDSQAEVDLNLVMTGNGGLIEIQGTAEKEPFTREHLQRFLEIGETGIKAILEAGRVYLEQA